MNYIKYSIEKHKQLNCYVIWKELVRDKGFNVLGIFHGTKKECQEKLKELKECM